MVGGEQANNEEVKERRRKKKKYVEERNEKLRGKKYKFFASKEPLVKPTCSHEM
jgi:hypothetical protein